MTIAHRTLMSILPALMLAAAMVVAAPQEPAPQVAAGIAAYNRADFRTAFAILKPIVYDASVANPQTPDPLAAAYLAQMLRRGEGTASDWPLACALFQIAYLGGRQRGPVTVEPIPFVTDGIREVCASQDGEVMALRTAGFLDGVTRHEFLLDGGARIVIDRLGFHLDLAGEHDDRGLSMGMHEVMVSITQADLAAARGPNRQRAHFLELFKWTNRIRDGHIVRDLHWIILEVRGVGLAVAMDQSIWTVIDGPYPSGEMPPGVREAAVLRVNAAGDVEWIVKGESRKHGVIAAGR